MLNQEPFEKPNDIIPEPELTEAVHHAQAMPTIFPGIDYVVYSDSPATSHIRLNGYVRHVGPANMESSLAEEDFVSILSGDADD